MPMLRKLLTVKKCGVAMNKATHKMNSPTKAPLFMIHVKTLFGFFAGFSAAWAAGLRAVVTGSPPLRWQMLRDRKSTRLNSSHVSISYAVFCLKKKKKKTMNKSMKNDEIM